MSAVSADDATETPTEVTSQAAPTSTGPSALPVRTRPSAASTDPPIAQGRLLPKRDRVRSESLPAMGAAMIPANPPAESTSPDQTTPSIQCPL